MIAILQGKYNGVWIVNLMTFLSYEREKIRKNRHAFLPHPPAWQKSESRRFEKISRGKANPFLPQK